MTEDPTTSGHPQIDTSVPHSARIWNYWMGGKDNYPVDREAGDAYAAVFPEITTLARQSRYFLIRTVHHLAAEAGIRQFLDIGTGLPSMENTHEVAQRAAPDAKIVYVDNDPMVLVHANALLTNTTAEGVTTYVEADVHDPDAIITAAAKTLDFGKPIAVMFHGILGHVQDYAEARSIVARVLSAVPSGSYLVLQDGTNTDQKITEAQQGYDDTGAVPYVLRSPAEVAGFFEGLETLEPGVVTVTEWRPADPEVGRYVHLDMYGGVARKP